MKGLIVRRVLIIILIISFPLSLKAQFNNTFNPVNPPGYTNKQDQKKKEGDEEMLPVKPKYTFKRYFNSLMGRDSMKIDKMWLGSLIVPGTAQIYNRDYWKVPVIYGGIGGFMYAGYKSNMKYHETGDSKYKTSRDLYYAGAMLTYWASVMDGLHNYKYYKDVLPARASLYSAMLPGLGQAYNGDYWKIPIFYGGLITCGYFIYENQSEYNRFKKLYIWASEENSDYDGSYSVTSLKWYKDTYRRYRDYSILSGALVYILNIVDANVFAHLRNFEISDDLSLNVDPAMIPALNPTFAVNVPATYGVKLKLNF